MLALVSSNHISKLFFFKFKIYDLKNSVKFSSNWVDRKKTHNFTILSLRSSIREFGLSMGIVFDSSLIKRVLPKEKMHIKGFQSFL